MKTWAASFDGKWTALGAAAVGFAMFQLLAGAAQVLAGQLDRALYFSLTASVRETLIRYRVWEIYRALLLSISAALCGWVVARVFQSRRTLAVTSVVVVIGASLLISLFTGSGYYLRDLAFAAAITCSPLIAVWSRRA
jgi:hypothetical protein